MDLKEVCGKCGIVADCCDYSESNGYMWQCECCNSSICTKCLESIYGKSISDIVDDDILCEDCNAVIE